MGCGASLVASHCHWETERVSGFKELMLRRTVVDKSSFRRSQKVSLCVVDADSSEELMKAHSVYKFGDTAKMRKTLKLTIDAEPDVIH